VVYKPGAYRLGLNLGSSKPLKQPLRIEQDRHRTLIHQFELHPCLEAPGSASNSGFTNPADKVFIELVCKFGWRGILERRPPAFARVALQGELGNHKHFARPIGNGEVHLAVLILEDAQSGDLCREIVGVGKGVGLANAEKDENPAVNSPYCFFADAHLSAAYPLNDGAHGPIC